jgi:hypothetical protein
MATPEMPRAPVPGTGKWESEGGALAQPASTELPEGVTAVTVTHYRVGPYTYTNLDDAMAQYRRQRSK